MQMSRGIPFCFPSAAALEAPAAETTLVAEGIGELSERLLLKGRLRYYFCFFPQGVTARIHSRTVVMTTV